MTQQPARKPRRNYRREYMALWTATYEVFNKQIELYGPDELNQALAYLLREEEEPENREWYRQFIRDFEDRDVKELVFKHPDDAEAVDPDDWADE